MENILWKQNVSFAVIGGSGLYSMPGLEDVKELELNTPFGKPSSPVVTGDFGRQEDRFPCTARDRTPHLPYGSKLPCKHLCIKNGRHYSNCQYFRVRLTKGRLRTRAYCHS